MRRNVTMLLSGIVATAFLTTVAAFPVHIYGATAKSANANASNKFSSATSYTNAPFDILKKGSTGNSVSLLQEKLALIGMFNKTKYYPIVGDYTVDILTKFQKSLKLTATGNYDKSTAAELDAKVYAYSNLVEPGDKSEIVPIVKRNLISLGFYKGKIDEILDKNLETSLTKYQTAKKLPPTGNIGSMTLKCIQWDLSKKLAAVTPAKKVVAKKKVAAKKKVVAKKKVAVKPVAKKVVAKKKKPTSVKSTSSTVKVSIVAYAKTFLKYRYVYGGASSRGYDCSGLMMSIMRKYGVNLPHSSAAQSKGGKKVSLSKLQPGDLLFFGRGTASIGHVGIYIGNDKFIHASTPSSGIKTNRVSTYPRKVVIAKRYPIHMVKR